MESLWQGADRVLRDSGRVEARGTTGGTRGLLTILITFGAVYGSVMGTFGWLFGAPSWQLLYAAVKVPFLLLIVFGVSLPSFLVLNVLVGLRQDARAVGRALLTTQAALAVVLASLAPLTLLWYCSSANYRHAVAFNAMVFGAASLIAQVLLRRQYQSLIRHNARHRWMMYVWVVLYAVIGIQAAWLLRPFVGNPHEAAAFFRPDAFSKNAYEVVLELLWRFWTAT